MNTNELKAKLNAAKAKLEANGWVKICTVMSADAGLKYGSHYKKDGVSLYLNKDTVEAYV